jgi:Tfp pilus assembly protein PilP
MRTLAAVFVVATLTSASAVSAQAPAAPTATAGTATVQTPAPPAVDTFTYDPEGRRDPFVSLTSRGSDQQGARPGEELEGARALGVDEISVRGIVATGSGYVAIVRGPSGKTFLVHQDDRLLDGTVKTITSQAVVMLQDVSDPLSLVKQKEIRKLLRGTEEGK